MQATISTAGDGATPVSGCEQFLDRDAGFIRHPRDYPINVHQTSAAWRYRRAQARGPGLMFEHARYLRPGSWLTVSIPLRDGDERFSGRVVMLRETPSGYQIGLHLLDDEQAGRLRIVEQFCYMSCYCRHAGGSQSHEHETNNGLAGAGTAHEHHARRWVEKFAAAFPSL